VVITARGIWVKARHAVMYRNLLCCLPRRGDLLPCAVVYLGVVGFFSEVVRGGDFIVLATRGTWAHAHTHTARRDEIKACEREKVASPVIVYRGERKSGSLSVHVSVRGGWCLRAGWVAVAVSTETHSASTLVQR